MAPTARWTDRGELEILIPDETLKQLGWQIDEEVQIDVKERSAVITSTRGRAEMRRIPNSDDAGSSPAGSTKHSAHCASQGSIGGQGLEFIPCDCGGA